MSIGYSGRESLATLRRYSGVLLYLLAGAIVAIVGLALNSIPVYDGLVNAARDLSLGEVVYLRNNGWYKYSPAFATIVSPFLWLPESLGATIWILLNFGMSGLALHVALPEKRRFPTMVLALLGILLVTSSDQANLLIGGLMLLGMLFYLRGQDTRAATAIVLGASVKVFPAVAGIWALKSRAPLKALLALAILTAAAVLLPLLVTSPRQAFAQYEAWLVMTNSEYSWSNAWSLSRMLVEFGVELPAIVVEIVVVAIAIAPILVRSQYFSQRQQLVAMASILIMVTLANHRSEEQTYVIAAMGAGLWYAAGPSRWWRLVLVLLAMSSLAPVFPAPGGIPASLYEMLTVGRPFFPTRLIPYVLLATIIQLELWRLDTVEPVEIPDRNSPEQVA
jgi:hypothetical protein